MIQNAANSSIGTLFIRFAREKGLRTINVVRRAEAIKTLVEHGGDVNLVDGDDLGERVRAATGGSPIRYGIDAVAGRSTMTMAECIAPGGLLVVYGLLSGEPCQISPNHLIAKLLTITGFRLKDYFDKKSRAFMQELYDKLAQRIAAGEELVTIEAVYPLSKIKAALEHAKSGARGKIILTMWSQAPEAS